VSQKKNCIFDDCPITLIFGTLISLSADHRAFSDRRG